MCKFKATFRIGVLGTENQQHRICTAPGVAIFSEGAQIYYIFFLFKEIITDFRFLSPSTWYFTSVVTISDDILMKLVFLWNLDQRDIYLELNNQNCHAVLEICSNLSIRPNLLLIVKSVIELNRAHFSRTWMTGANELKSVSKLRTYKSFKSEFYFEKYVFKDFPESHRSILA